MKIINLIKKETWQSTDDYRVRVHLMFIHEFPSYYPERKYVSSRGKIMWQEIPTHCGRTHFWNDYEDAVKDICVECPGWTEDKQQRKEMAAKARNIEDEKRYNMNAMLAGVSFRKLKWKYNK